MEVVVQRTGEERARQRRSRRIFQGCKKPRSQSMVRAHGEGGTVLRAIKAATRHHSAQKPHEPQGVYQFGSVFYLFCVLIFPYSSRWFCVLCVSWRCPPVSHASTSRPLTDHRPPPLVSMPRCLMAKKWKAYPWPPGASGPDDDEEEIDVVGDAPGPTLGPCWGPSSPTAAATAPSPPPQSPLPSDTGRASVLYSGEYPRAIHVTYCCVNLFSLSSKISSVNNYL